MSFLGGLLDRFRSKRNEQYSVILGRMEYCSSFIDSVLATDGYIQKKAYSSELLDLNDTAENAAKLSGRRNCIPTSSLPLFLLWLLSELPRPYVSPLPDAFPV